MDSHYLLTSTEGTQEGPVYHYHSSTLEFSTLSLKLVLVRNVFEQIEACRALPLPRL